MLEARHIIRLKLSRERLLAHRQMPPPSYSTKELTSQIAAIGDATIAKLLDVPPEIFQMQLDAARSYGASYLMLNKAQQTIGISAETSLIKDDNVLNKNLILPRDYLWKNPQLNWHYILGVFVHGEVVNGEIPDVSEVEVAGWTDTRSIRSIKRATLPPNFKSNLPVVMIPCEKLKPVSQLIQSLSMSDAAV